MQSGSSLGWLRYRGGQCSHGEAGTMMDGWTRYGMTPEQVTPEWKKAREALWKEEVSCHHKGDGFPRSYTAQ